MYYCTAHKTCSVLLGVIGQENIWKSEPSEHSCGAFAKLGFYLAIPVRFLQMKTLKEKHNNDFI
jgi:hypothetical protein